MEYRPITCVWEVTMGCNMRCGHCGSSCKTALPGELTTSEALMLADMIGDLKLSWVTLSGGEPLTRKDLPEIIKRLRLHGVDANIITNGWELTNDVSKELKDAGVATVAISIDGTEEIHDKIRRPGAFSRAKKAFEALNQEEIYTASITTISKENIGKLKDIKNELISMGVKMWQVQIGLPMGNFTKHQDWMIDPSQVQDIIDFCYDTSLEGKILIQPADCIGYYNRKLDYVNLSNACGRWDGCGAGVRNFGILHNGDILGCTSIRDKSFIEGNIRERSLREIWEDPKSFAWRRNLLKYELSGDCGKCRYGDECLGGCPNSRLTTKGSVYEENLYCSFNYLMKKFRNKLTQFNDADFLFNKTLDCLKAGSYQEALLVSERLLGLSHAKETVLLNKIANYRCGNIKELQFTDKENDIMESLFTESELDSIVKVNAV